MAKVTYERLDFGRLVIYIDNVAEASWFTNHDNTSPSVEGITEIIKYFVDRLEAAENRITNLENELCDYQEMIADRMSRAGGI